MFSFRKIVHPHEQGSYAVTTGVFAGEILIYIQKQNDSYEFLSIPKMINRQVPIDKFKVGLENKIVDTVGDIPNKVYKMCKLQFAKNKTINK